MSVAGNLATMALPDLLHWVDQAQKTGSLLIHGKRYTKTLVTKKGQIVASSSTDPNDHLGHYVLRQGQVTEEQLRWAIEQRWKTGELLGRILVEAGWIAEKELQRLLSQQAVEVIFGLFLSCDGRFEFQDQVVPDKIHVPVDLGVNDVLLAGSTWVDELEHVRQVFASEASVPGWKDHASPLELHGMDFLSERILGLVNGRNSIAMICTEVHAPEFTVSKLLFLLHERGQLEVSNPREGEEEPRSEQITRLMREAGSLLLIGEAEAGWMVLEEVREIDAANKEVHRQISRARAAFIHQTRILGMTRQAVPYLTKPPESLLTESLSPDEMVIFSWVNGSWNIETILSSCSFPEAEALLLLKHLKERGFIGFVAEKDAGKEIIKEPLSLVATAGLGG
jgi:hypothetical protein